MLVQDDQSGDNTRAILDKLSYPYSKLKCWMVKTHPRGVKLLFFINADTFHQPETEGYEEGMGGNS